MGKNGGVKYDEWMEFAEKLDASQVQVDEFMASCAKELTARLLRKVIKKTPTGEYLKSSGKNGGTLKRGWTGGQSGAKFVDSLQVYSFGSGYYVIAIENPVEYASYVEFGHRTRNKKGWVTGKFMLTISEQEIERSAPAILEKKLTKWLEEILK